VRTKVSYDLEYIRRQSLREDLRIMLKTIPVILLRRGGWWATRTVAPEQQHRKIRDPAADTPPDCRPPTLRL